jgi:hypothetical protein
MLTLEMQSDPMPVGVKLWKAEAGGLDFREAKWASEPLKIENPHTQASIPIPSGGQHIAIFGELEFQYGQRKYSLTTLVYCK